MGDNKIVAQNKTVYIFPAFLVAPFVSTVCIHRLYPPFVPTVCIHRLYPPFVPTVSIHCLYPPLLSTVSIHRIKYLLDNDFFLGEQSRLEYSCQKNLDWKVNVFLVFHNEIDIPEEKDYHISEEWPLDRDAIWKHIH
jgi:hypothetical protein